MKKAALIGALIMCFSMTSVASVQSTTFELEMEVDYPEYASESKVEGTVIVEFEIKNGSAMNISIIQSVENSLDDAVVKIVEQLSDEQLLELEKCGKKVFRLPVNFDLV